MHERDDGGAFEPPAAAGGVAAEGTGTELADGAADRSDGAREVRVTREPVELYKVLKFEGLAGSGGEAKGVIDGGLVRVNGEVETRRRRKLVDGDTVEFAGTTLRVRAA